MKQNKPEISVAVVAYNSARWLPDCLSSLKNAGGEFAVEVLVVDNASRDGSADLVRREFPTVKLLVNRRNLGYARAVNQAARHTSGRYLLILNPDVVVNPGALEELRDHLERETDVALVAPRLLNPDGSLQYSCRRHYTWGTYLLRRAPLRHLLPHHTLVRRHLMMDWDHEQTREVDWVLGAAMMMRRDALGEEIMDERYFLYFEDVDLCLRLQRQGWKVVYHPGATMTHVHRRESGRGMLNRRKYQHFRSWVQFQWKHLRLEQRRSVR